jgi:hypothetical protein
LNVLKALFDIVQVLHICSALAIPAGVEKQFTNWPMYARASLSFHGNPWYSDVAIHMEPKGLPEETEYVQLQLLFKVDLFQTSNNTLVTKELTLVRMYQKVPPNKLNRLIMCEEIKWVLPILKQPTRPSTSYEMVQQLGSYSIIKINNILHAIQVVPNFLEKTHFFVNSFKF